MPQGIRGLNPWARGLVGQVVICQEFGTRVYPDGRREAFDRKVSVSLFKAESSEDFFRTSDFEKHYLAKYTLPGGIVYFEKFQCEVRIGSQSDIFLCLTDGQGNCVQESLWSENETHT